MAVGFDAKMTGGNGAGGTFAQVAAALSLSDSGMTVGAGATLLLAVAVWQDNASTDPTSRAITWGGVSMTERSTVLASTGTERVRVSVFRLVSPASGNKALAATWATATCDFYMSCASFTGTDTATGTNDADDVTTTNVTTINVTSDATGATLALFGVNGAAPTLNFNAIFTAAPLNPGGGASYQLGGSSNGHTFTGAGGTIQALAGVHILASGTPPLITPDIVYFG